MTDPYGGNWGRIVRPGGSGMPRPMGSGLAGRMVRPMGRNVGSTSAFCTTRYFDASGTEQWHRDHGGIVRDVAITSDGYVYECGDAGFGGYHLRKRSPTGSLLWSKNHGASLVMCDVTPSGGVVVGGNAGTTGRTIRQYDADGALEWSATTVYDVFTLDVDREGTIICNAVNDQTFSGYPLHTWVYFFQSDGTLISEIDYAGNGPPFDLTSGLNTFETRPVVCVAFNELANYPYTAPADERWRSIFWRQLPLTSTFWYISENGIMVPSVNQPLAVTGVAYRMATKDDIPDFSAPFSGSAIAATTDLGTRVSTQGSVLGVSTADDQTLGGSPFPLAIGADGNIYNADGTVYKMYNAQRRDLSHIFNDGWVTPPPPWNPVPARTTDHGASIYGCDVNDSGVNVMGGDRAAL